MLNVREVETAIAESYQQFVVKMNEEQLRQTSYCETGQASIQGERIGLPLQQT